VESPANLTLSMSENIPIAETFTVFQVRSFNLEEVWKVQLKTKKSPFLSRNQTTTFTFLIAYDS
jgi:hypothetical protein